MRTTIVAFNRIAAAEMGGDMPYTPEWRRIEILDDMVAAALRNKTPAERVALGLSCNRTARLLIEGHLLTRFPEWTQQQISAEVARRMCREPS
jgi:hypothetical protein